RHGHDLRPLPRERLHHPAPQPPAPARDDDLLSFQAHGSSPRRPLRCPAQRGALATVRDAWTTEADKSAKCLESLRVLSSREGPRGAAEGCGGAGRARGRRVSPCVGWGAPAPAPSPSCSTWASRPASPTRLRGTPPAPWPFRRPDRHGLVTRAG